MQPTLRTVIAQMRAHNGLQQGLHSPCPVDPAHLNTEEILSEIATGRKWQQLPTPTGYVQGSLGALLVFSSGLSLTPGLAMPYIVVMGHWVPETSSKGRRRHFGEETG